MKNNSMGDNSIDKLTGLANRNALISYVSKLIKERENQVWQIAMVHIDSIGGINKSYGFEEGDNALRDLADILLKLSHISYAGRYENDEFIIFASPEHKMDDVLKEADEAVAALNNKGKRPFTLKIGHIQEQFMLKPGLSPEDIFEKLDEKIHQP